MRATSGNFSLRVQDDPLEFFISVSGRDKSINRADDFIRVNERGEVKREKGRKGLKNLSPSAEVGVHAEIYRKCSPGVVLHVHSLYNTYISLHSPDPDLFLIQDLEMIKGLGIGGDNPVVRIPIVPNASNLEELARSAGKVIQSSTPGILIRGHGLYAWGATLHEAKRNVEAFEFLFEYLALEMRRPD
ncbi:MAG: methylthioribulose 1-phosphate dehydratase [Nitrospirae bacterium]|nr:methylthioribulose 1-phosphate dehydratase [Nitrospirota bacterium]MBI3594691.1 methylthioribulose 1-phosphate dehydratase [Nitrospirota bacterium]